VIPIPFGLRRNLHPQASGCGRARARPQSLETCLERQGSGADLKVGRDPGFVVERGLYDSFLCSSWSASGWSYEAVEVAGFGRVVGAVGASASRSSPPFPLAGPVALPSASVSGGDPLCLVHGHALAGGALPGAWFAKRRDLSPSFGRVVAAGAVPERDRGLAATVGGGGQA